jgi:DNA-binding NarL/FixJ family response regulator
VTDAVLAGACGYLLKDASVEDIVAGVRAAAIGDSMVSPRMARTLLQQLRGHRQNDARPTTDSLSTREREVLRLVVEGKDNAAIATELFISPYTVKNHISNILLKLRVENRLQAAVCAVRDSLV